MNTNPIRFNSTLTNSGNQTSTCTSHCIGQQGPACMGQGHCQPNVFAELDRRPSRADTIALLRARQTT